MQRSEILQVIVLYRHALICWSAKPEEAGRSSVDCGPQSVQGRLLLQDNPSTTTGVIRSISIGENEAAVFDRSPASSDHQLTYTGLVNYQRSYRRLKVPATRPNRLRVVPECARDNVPSRPTWRCFCVAAICLSDDSWVSLRSSKRKSITVGYIRGPITRRESRADTMQCMTTYPLYCAPSCTWKI